jgi:hypothetical protein
MVLGTYTQVVMQPTGTLGLLGLQSQMLFMRDLLDKVKVGVSWAHNRH